MIGLSSVTVRSSNLDREGVFTGSLHLFWVDTCRVGQSGLGGVDLEGRGELPGEQFVDAVNGVVGDLRGHGRFLPRDRVELGPGVAAGRQSRAAHEIGSCYAS